MFQWTVWLVLATAYAGCGRPVVSTTKTVPRTARPVAQNATREELLAQYNAMAAGIQAINATVELTPVAGSQYSGVIEEYHEVKAFLLAQRPAEIRVIGEAPVIGKNVFDMASDGARFSVSIPSKNKFLVGPVNSDRVSEKPIENLRPQHLLDALLWPQIRKEEQVPLQEFNDEAGRYYILTVLRGGYQMEVLRTIWFDRTDLQVVRLQTFGPKGVLLSDMSFSNWQPLVPAEQSPAEVSGVSAFPRTIRIERPHDDYRLDMQVTKLALNPDIPAERFHLEQPAGSELVHVGEPAGSNPQ
jgi:hypothetical protein